MRFFVTQNTVPRIYHIISYHMLYYDIRQNADEITKITSIA